MDPGLFFAGIVGGLLIALGYQDATARRVAVPPGVPGGPPVHPKIAEAQRVFLPTTAENIQLIRVTEPEATRDWKSIAGRVPYLTETVAMYYTMEDPGVPVRPKLQIAGAILYALSPMDLIPDSIPILGQLDDAGALIAAFYDVWGHIDPRHMVQAQEWLRSQGIEPKPLFAIGKDFSADAAAIQELVTPEGVLQLPGPVAGSPGQPAAPPPEFKGWY